MAASILSTDLVGICLILVEGNACAALEDVIRAAEEFQQKHNRHFGISRSDFRMLFWNYYHSDLHIQNIALHEIIPFILSFHAAHFNDEGGHLFGNDTGIDFENYEGSEMEREIKYWTGYGKEEFRRKLETRAAMNEYFRDKTHQAEAVRTWMATQGIDEYILYHCSRPGVSS